MRKLAPYIAFAWFITAGEARGEGAARYFFTTFPRHLVRDARESFWGSHLAAIALIGGPVTGAVRTQDKGFQAQVNEHRYIGDTDEAGSQLGMPYAQFGYVGAAYGLGRLFPSSGLGETSEPMFESLSVTTVATHLLKIAIRRDRPDESNSLSFPSNHASGTFALATTLQLQHGWRAGIPAYMLASYVSFSRIQENKHFASDTVFGAVLGITVAHATWKVHHEGGPRARHAALLPILTNNSIGVAFSTRL